MGLHNHGITAPFSEIPRAKLERLVQEGFEHIEKLAAEEATDNKRSFHYEWFYSHSEFQILMAAFVYLSTTKGSE